MTPTREVSIGVTVQALAAILAGFATVPVTVDAEGIGGYDRTVEAAVDLRSLEAWNSIATYAKASGSSVRLPQDDGVLTSVVRGDGAEFDTATTDLGTGVQGMADRLDAISGTLPVASTPGAGTSVTGATPLEVVA